MTRPRPAGYYTLSIWSTQCEAAMSTPRISYLVNLSTATIPTGLQVSLAAGSWIRPHSVTARTWLASVSHPAHSILPSSRAQPRSSWRLDPFAAPLWTPNLDNTWAMTIPGQPLTSTCSENTCYLGRLQSLVSVIAMWGSTPVGVDSFPFRGRSNLETKLRSSPWLCLLHGYLVPRCCLQTLDMENWHIWICHLLILRPNNIGYRVKYGNYIPLDQILCLEAVLGAHLWYECYPFWQKMYIRISITWFSNSWKIKASNFRQGLLYIKKLF